MWNFGNVPICYPIINPLGDNSVLEIGYDDFNQTKAAPFFRIQPFYTWHFVISGNGTLEIEDQRYALTAGDMFFIPPNTKMRYFPNENDPWKYVWFSLAEETAPRCGELIGFLTGVYVQKNPYPVLIERMLYNLLSSLAEKSSWNSSVLATFYTLMDLCTDHISLGEIEYVRKMIRVCCVNPTFTIENLCRSVGVSHSHLLRLFKAKYGMTMIRYLTECRVAHACKLLQTTDLSVSAVAYSSGFADELHFMKVFKRSVGVTALQYRKAAKS